MSHGGARQGAGRKRNPMGIAEKLQKIAAERAAAQGAAAEPAAAIIAEVMPPKPRPLDPIRAAAQELAKDVLAKGMKLSEGAAGYFQPVAPAQKAAGQINPNEDWGRFGEWVDRMGYFAKELAKYQSPTFKAIMTAPAPEMNQPEKRRRFSLTIFEDGQPRKVADVDPMPPAKTGNGAA